MFVVFQPTGLPESQRFIQLWQKLSRENGLPGIHFVGTAHNGNWNCAETGFDMAVNQFLPPPMENNKKKNPAHPTIYRYGNWVQHFVPPESPESLLYPCVLPNWDNTPRSGANGMVLHESTPELFRSQFRQALGWSRDKLADSGVIFIKAWNEWAEGNYLEPDLRFGHGYLQVIKEELEAYEGVTTLI